MANYLQVARTLPVPSPEQVRSFVDYVTEAHSWYKHLPLLPPGRPFYFFLDPNAGRDLVVDGARMRYYDRKEQGFHYADIPTAEYRQRYGYLQYSTGAGPSFIVPRSTGVLLVSSNRSPLQVSLRTRIWTELTTRILSLTGFRPAGNAPDVAALSRAAESRDPQLVAIQSAEQEQISVPREILEAGCVQLTGIIHPLASTFWIWGAKAQDAQSASSRWPAETGGSDTVLKVLHCLKDKPSLQSSEIQDGSDDKPMGFHPVIHALVDPERQRLKKLMEEAIYRIVYLVCR